MRLIPALVLIPAFAFAHDVQRAELFDAQGRSMGVLVRPDTTPPPVKPPPVEPPPAAQCDPRTAPVHNGVRNYVFNDRTPLALCVKSNDFAPQGIFGATPGSFPGNVNSNTIKTMTVSPQPFDMVNASMGPECKKSGNILTLRTATGQAVRGKCRMENNRIYYLNVSPETFAGVNACPTNTTCGARIQADQTGG